LGMPEPKRHRLPPLGVGSTDAAKALPFINMILNRLLEAPVAPSCCQNLMFGLVAFFRCQGVAFLLTSALGEIQGVRDHATHGHDWAFIRTCRLRFRTHSVAFRCARLFGRGYVLRALRAGTFRAAYRRRCMAMVAGGSRAI
jgi:hypothetical protein